MQKKNPGAASCLSRDFSGGTESIQVEHFLRVIHPKTDQPQTLLGKSGWGLSARVFDQTITLEF